MSKLNPRTVILKLLLAKDGALAARDAVAACALLGIRENSTRVALVRLASSELVEAAGRGTYRLGPGARGLASELSAWRSAEDRVRPWAGDWIAVPTGSAKRADRGLLRARERALELVGMREVEKGLHVRPDNLIGGVATVRQRLRTLDPDFDVSVFVAREFDGEREARMRASWNGAALTRSYREMRQKLDEWLDRADDLEPLAAARESYLLGDKAIRQVVFDPLLPAPLVDVEERRAFHASVVRFDRAGHAIWRRLAFRELDAAPVTETARTHREHASNHRPTNHQH